MRRDSKSVIIPSQLNMKEGSNGGAEKQKCSKICRKQVENGRNSSYQ